MDMFESSMNLSIFNSVLEILPYVLSKESTNKNFNFKASNLIYNHIPFVQKVPNLVTAAYVFMKYGICVMVSPLLIPSSCSRFWYRLFNNVLVPQVKGLKILLIHYQRAT